MSTCDGVLDCDSLHNTMMITIDRRNDTTSQIQSNFSNFHFLLGRTFFRDVHLRVTNTTPNNKENNRIPQRIAVVECIFWRGFFFKDGLFLLFKYIFFFR